MIKAIKPGGRLPYTFRQARRYLPQPQRVSPPPHYKLYCVVTEEHGRELPEVVTQLEHAPSGSRTHRHSVQFAKINVVLSAKALQEHDTVISVIDAVVAGKENVFRSRRNEDKVGAAVTLAGSVFHARAPATGNARSTSEDRRVAGTTTSVLEADCKYRTNMPL